MTEDERAAAEEEYQRPRVITEGEYRELRAIMDIQAGTILRLVDNLSPALERIADALEAQPSLRDQMAMALLIRGKSNFRDVYKQANEVLATRQKEE